MSADAGNATSSSNSTAGDATPGWAGNASEGTSTRSPGILRISFTIATWTSDEALDAGGDLQYDVTMGIFGVAMASLAADEYGVDLGDVDVTIVAVEMETEDGGWLVVPAPPSPPPTSAPTIPNLPPMPTPVPTTPGDPAWCPFSSSAADNPCKASQCAGEVPSEQCKQVVRGYCGAGGRMDSGCSFFSQVSTSYGYEEALVPKKDGLVRAVVDFANMTVAEFEEFGVSEAFKRAVVQSVGLSVSEADVQIVGSSVLSQQSARRLHAATIDGSETWTTKLQSHVLHASDLGSVRQLAHEVEATGKLTVHDVALQLDPPDLEAADERVDDAVLDALKGVEHVRLHEELGSTQAVAALRHALAHMWVMEHFAAEFSVVTADAARCEHAKLAHEVAVWHARREAGATDFKRSHNA